MFGLEYDRRNEVRFRREGQNDPLLLQSVIVVHGVNEVAIMLHALERRKGE